MKRSPGQSSGKGNRRGLFVVLFVLYSVVLTGGAFFVGWRFGYTEPQVLVCTAKMDSIVVRVEENGTVFARDPGSSHEHADYQFSVHEVYTKLVRSTGGKFTLEELKSGDQIEIWYTGERATSYPAVLGSVGKVCLLEDG